VFLPDFWRYCLLASLTLGVPAPAVADVGRYCPLVFPLLASPPLGVSAVGVQSLFPVKYHLIPYGCQMNTADSAEMAQPHQNRGFTATADPAQADVIMINTRTVPSREVHQERICFRHDRIGINPAKHSNVLRIEK